MTRPRCAIWRSVHRGRGDWLGQLVLYVVAWQDAVLAGIVSAPGVLTFVTVTPGAIPCRPSGTKTVVRSSPLASYSSTFTPVAGTIALLPTASLAYRSRLCGLSGLMTVLSLPRGTRPQGSAGH